MVKKKLNNDKFIMDVVRSLQRRGATITFHPTNKKKLKKSF